MWVWPVSNVANLMQISWNKWFCSFTLGSAHEKNDVWNGPIFIAFSLRFVLYTKLLIKDEAKSASTCGVTLSRCSKFRVFLIDSTAHKVKVKLTYQVWWQNKTEYKTAAGKLKRWQRTEQCCGQIDPYTCRLEVDSWKTDCNGRRNVWTKDKAVLRWYKKNNTKNFKIIVLFTCYLFT